MDLPFDSDSLISNGFSHMASSHIPSPELGVIETIIPSDPIDQEIHNSSDPNTNKRPKTAESDPLAVHLLDVNQSDKPINLDIPASSSATSGNLDNHSKITELKKRKRDKIKKGNEANGTNGPRKSTDPSEASTLSHVTSQSLEVMNESWIKPKYQPIPSKLPTEVAFAAANSSKMVFIHSPLVINARGYNLAGCNYPVQSGKWYYELEITDVPTVLQHINNFVSTHAASNATGASTSSEDPLNNESSAMKVDPTEDHHQTNDIDYRKFADHTNQLNEMRFLTDNSRRPLPDSHWRLGWGTEYADVECPVGTDHYGFAWRDDGTLFHCARPVHKYLQKVLEDPNSARSRPVLVFSNNAVQGSSSDPNLLAKIEGYSVGDVLGFGIELPESNRAYIQRIHEHQDDLLTRQENLYELRRSEELFKLSSNANIPGFYNPEAPRKLAEVREKIQKIESEVPKLDLPQTLPGTKLNFWKNGVLQSISITDIPPGSYYPYTSMYYLGGIISRFGPHFKYGTPEGHTPLSSLPAAYVVPIHSRFVSPEQPAKS